MGSAIKGQPSQQNVTIPPPLRPPMSGFANWMGDQLPGLWGQSLPSYGGQFDYGLSPTQSQATRFMQDRARSPGPAILGQAQGSLGALMDPGMSGMRNPYSMSSSSMGGSNVLSPANLQSSRDALMRYQNPTMQIARPGGGGGVPNFFPGATPKTPSQDFTMQSYPMTPGSGPPGGGGFQPPPWGGAQVPPWDSGGMPLQPGGGGTDGGQTIQTKPRSVGGVSSMNGGGLTAGPQTSSMSMPGRGSAQTYSPAAFGEPGSGSMPPQLPQLLQLLQLFARGR
jgi:hypothetical protein